MIGPHHGKELLLMLDGQKHLAIFYDIVIGKEKAPEEIIPEKMFAPYVQNGMMTQHVRTFVSPKIIHPLKYVCYTLAGHEWRAEAFFWIHQECVNGRRPFDDAYEFFVGRLLDYSEEDIQEFVEDQKKQRAKPAAS